MVETRDLAHIRRVTADQVAFGNKLGLDLEGCTISVAAARIRLAVKKGFCGSSDDRRPTQKQIEFASRYGYDIRELEREVADAVVDDLMTELNLQAVDSEGLAPGVQVFNVHDPKRAEVVSSIRADGTVYLKGGQGRKAWARNLRRMRSESS